MMKWKRKKGGRGKEVTTRVKEKRIEKEVEIEKRKGKRENKRKARGNIKKERKGNRR